MFLSFFSPRHAAARSDAHQRGETGTVLSAVLPQFQPTHERCPIPGRRQSGVQTHQWASHPVTNSWLATGATMYRVSGLVPHCTECFNKWKIVNGDIIYTKIKSGRYCWNVANKLEMVLFFGRKLVIRFEWTHHKDNPNSKFCFYCFQGIYIKYMTKSGKLFVHINNKYIETKDSENVYN